MKSYTDLSQSKTLSKILPHETADMCWTYDFDTKCFTIKMYPYSRLVIPKYADSKITNPIPAWSLSALLDVLPKIHKLKPILDLEECSILYSGTDIYVTASNPVDACVEMILKLHGLNLL